MMTYPLLAVIAEVTHRCPLHCVYCSNPLEMKSRQEELSTGDWLSVFEQAGKMGALQLDITGGEPLARADLTDLVAGARKAKLYVNLITSGVGLNEARLDALLEAGLDHIQLSFQDALEAPANEFAGTRAHAVKLALAAQISSRRVAFTMNAVVHRANLDRLDEIIALAEELAPHRLEVAHVQYYGWAAANREALLPTREQLDRSVEIVETARRRLKGKMRIEFVTPDYYGKFPKACMGGWGRKLMLVTPAGEAMPCHAAGVIPEMHFDSVIQHPLLWLWEESPAFQKFRGEHWMPEPCRGCDRRTLDFGGCRCQALLLAGDAAATDPTCSLAPARPVVDAILARVNSVPEIPAATTRPDWVYRVNPAN
jgi:pyrroloquinoline quinone biosynthesis protein E